MGWVVLAAVAVATGAAVGGLLVWARRRFVLVAVVGRSMEPTLRGGDRVLARRTAVDRVRGGDLVVLGPPDGPVAEGGLLVKRAIAVPGDPLPRDRVPALAATPDGLVPAGHLVVLGDNPLWSMDSRQLGLFPADRLLGVLVRRR